MERIVGPVRRHYFAAYTVRADEGFYGYAKVCPDRPEGVWDTATVLFKVGAGPYPSEEAALATVIDKAESELRDASEWQLLWEFACR